jgi:hypothetical protein
MRKAILGVFALALVLVGSGCGNDPHEAIYKDLVGLMNDMATVFEGVKDKASAEAAKPKLQEINKRLKEIGERAKKAGKISKAKADSLEKKYKPQLEAAGKRLDTAASGLKGNRDVGLILLGPMMEFMQTVSQIQKDTQE